MLQKNGKIRGNRVFIIIIGIIISFAIMWPGYAWFSGYEPFILGVPLSFAWIILWVIVGFASMLYLYISDNKSEEEES